MGIVRFFPVKENISVYEVETFDSDDYSKLIKEYDFCRINFEGYFKKISLEKLFLNINIEKITCDDVMIHRCMNISFILKDSLIKKFNCSFSNFLNIAFTNNDIKSFNFFRVNSADNANFNKNKLTGVFNSCVLTTLSFRANKGSISFNSSYLSDSIIYLNSFEPLKDYCSTFINSNLSSVKFENNYYSGKIIDSYNDKMVFTNCDGISSFLPEEGSFIGWKGLVDVKGEKKLICKLLIDENSKRLNTITGKCRCERAKVLSIEDFNGVEYDEAVSAFYDGFKYRVGEYVECDKFDENPTNDCSNGINFFILKNQAINYTKYYINL